MCMTIYIFMSTGSVQFPKILHLTCPVGCKDGGKFPYPQWNKCYAAYRSLYKDYEIRLYDDNDIYQIIEKAFPDDLTKVKRIKIGAVLADVFRYLILYLVGGVYADLDCYPKQPLTTLFTDCHYHGDATRGHRLYIYPRNLVLVDRRWDSYLNPCDNCTKIKAPGALAVYKCLGHKFLSQDKQVVVCEEFDLGQDFESQIGQWFIISKPKHPLFLNCYKACLKNIRILANLDRGEEGFVKKVMHNSGPQLFTRQINRLKGQNAFKTICILPKEFFCLGKAVAATPNTYVKHMFSGSWK
ncbi:glycosyltransferase [uncultured Mediterranean phage]|nr:glycosyltransferase [uncultured Mediterranean phage]